MVSIEAALRYDPETGSLIWLPRGNARFDNRNAGNIAGAKRSDGYISVGFNNKAYLAHRLIWRFVYGEWPEFEIDHINGDKADNRIENLRACTTAENRRNMPVRRNKTSRYSGVRKSRNAWSVVIDSKIGATLKPKMKLVGMRLRYTLNLASTLTMDAPKGVLHNGLYL
jgi:hypothetical protein